MYRNAIKQLHEWKSSPYRKPLIIRGARQVGKTWLMQEFGRIAYAKTVYVNCDNNSQMQELFSPDLNTDRLIAGLELYSGLKITADDTLIIFDEVQEIPAALTSLKYFNENAPQYQIICAGSLLGIALHHGTSFPVGKVEFIDLYPMTYTEFLMATGNDRFAETLVGGDFALSAVFKTTYVDALKSYYYVGGMPEAVAAFAGNRDFNQVQGIQARILDTYEQDFSKHAPYETVPRIRMIWNSIPTQLAKENKKFIYGQIKEGARAKDYELALMWLSDCGLVSKVHRLTAPNVPLKAYEDLRAFKLFMVDVGLLSCMTGLKPQTFLDGNALFKEFKGALTEQYVFQQLKTLKNISTHYWNNERSSAEIDFIIGNGHDVVPLEVKAEINLQAKSLKTYREKYAPRVAVRASMADYRVDGGLVNLPLYAVEMMERVVGLWGSGVGL